MDRTGGQSGRDRDTSGRTGRRKGRHHSENHITQPKKLFLNCSRGPKVGRGDLEGAVPCLSGQLSLCIG